MPSCSTDPEGYPFDPAETARLSRLRLALEYERCRSGRLSASTDEAANVWRREERAAHDRLVAACRQDRVNMVRVDDLGLLLRVDAAGEIVRERFDPKIKMHQQPYAKRRKR